MSLQHLILGLLDRRPQSGYDLNKTVQRTVQNFWSTDQSQIYRTLYKLEEKGLIRMEYIEQDDNPDKKLYHVTQAGRDELVRWITTPITQKQSPVREGWLGQLFFGDLVSNEEIITVLQTYRDSVAEAVAHLEGIQRVLNAQNDASGGSRNLELIMMTSDYGVFIQRSWLQWLDEAIKKVRDMDDIAASDE